MTFLTRFADGIEKLLRPVARVGIYIAMVSLCLTVLFMVADVISRNIFNAGFPGTKDIEQFLLCFITFLGLPWVTLTAHHVRVDLIVNKFPKWGQHVTDTCTSVLGLMIWVFITWKTGSWAMKISGTDAFILIDRGWIPFEDWQTRQLSAYDEPVNVTIEGMLRVSQTKLGLRDCLDETAGETPFQVWCLALDGISDYLPYELASVYVIEAPTGDPSELPYRSIPKIEISEGPHLSYAIQWFTFSAILLIGYPFFVRRELQARERKAQQEMETEDEYHGWAEHLNEEQKDVYGIEDD